MGLLASCSAEVLSAALLLLLFSSTALSQCPAPVLPPHSSLKGGGDLAESYAVDTTLRLQCIPGYDYLPGTIPAMRCLDTSKWSDLPALCQGKTCGHPGEPDGGRLLVTGNFDLGSTANYQCNEGHRLIGQSTRRCKVLNNKMAWTDQVPYCEIIPCLPPPNIPHGKHSGMYLKEFYYGTAVKYTCDKGYPLTGNASIYCTSKDGINGEWSGRAYCGVPQCPSPQIKNGRIVAGVSSTYTYNQKVSFECIGGHNMVGSKVIYCQMDGTWNPPIPVCESGRQCPPPPDIQNGIRSNQETGVFPSGILVKYTCNPGYVLIGAATLLCTNAGRWSSPAPNCEVNLNSAD